YHRVVAEFEHQHAIGHAERQRTARATFADDGADDRHRAARHDLDRRADRFALAALFRADAAVSAGRVDEGEDRQTEALGQLVDANGFAVAFRVGHPEISPHV